MTTFFLEHKLTDYTGRTSNASASGCAPISASASDPPDHPQALRVGSSYLVPQIILEGALTEALCIARIRIG